MVSKYRVTISTSGIVPALRKLREVCDVSLAVSLHAPDNALRDQLVVITSYSIHYTKLYDRCEPRLAMNADRPTETVNITAKEY